jgi:hypothetical protein
VPCRDEILQQLDGIAFGDENEGKKKRKKRKTGAAGSDDGFYVLTSQVYQVFYVEDGRNPDWVCAVRNKPRNVYDVGQGEGNHDADATYHECVPLVLAIADIHDMNDEFKHDRPDIDLIEALVG